MAYILVALRVLPTAFLKAIKRDVTMVDGMVVKKVGELAF